jgi:hypothetical protein
MAVELIWHRTHQRYLAPSKESSLERPRVSGHPSGVPLEEFGDGGHAGIRLLIEPIACEVPFDADQKN